ncbi:uncharacterized protein CDV56_104541 [Aspergillus thermomutatus]|uniref:Vacuolar calcium ion transporter n=1 Tax=Aspergillus thermomutatus TaxID=41047 RepID=A0A397GLN6_ASPTH|nr:uncharacterized protein CDV56_104541 [Aspergillus thermomutatus]RHZ51795.1 hypothetical protein CDV56_104541 [Aspergillus thermomutatus]
MSSSSQQHVAEPPSPENEPLLNEDTFLRESAREIYIQPLWTGIRTTLASSCANLFLPSVFLGIASASLGWGDTATFVLNLLAIFPLASLLSFATEELAKSVGAAVGGLINATFGNAVEMIVGATAVNRGEIHIVQASMIGSVLSGDLLILGSCFFAGGYNRETLRFSPDVSQIMSSLMVVITSFLLIPSALYVTTRGPVTDTAESVLDLSRAAAIVLLLFYLVYLYFKLKSHAEVFVCDGEEDGEEEIRLGPWSASLVLILATLGVTTCSDSLVDSVDGMVETWGISRAFIGLIVVPVVGNAGEFSTTVNAAIKGNLGLAIGLIAESTLQIAVFVTPLMVVWGWIIDQPMSLHFNTFEIAVFSLAVILTRCLMREGHSNWFQGYLLIGMYLILAIAFYVHPDLDHITQEVPSG